MCCEKYLALIDKCIEGDIGEEEYQDLKLHMEKCSACRDEFNKYKMTERIVRENLSGKTTSKQAKDIIVAGLTSPKKAFAAGGFSGMRKSFAATAAAILLIAGVVGGFYAGRAHIKEETRGQGAKVSGIKAEEVAGTVLVRHEGGDIWGALNTGSAVYRGDTFHCAAKSRLRLGVDGEGYVELSQNSMLVLKEYNGGTEFYLDSGKLKAELESPHPPFVVGTPNGRVEALGTEFTVSVK